MSDEFKIDDRVTFSIPENEGNADTITEAWDDIQTLIYSDADIDLEENTNGTHFMVTISSNVDDIIYSNKEEIKNILDSYELKYKITED